MAQIAKIEAKAEISSPPAKVYDFFKNNINDIVNVFPQVFKSAELIEGEEGRDGNVKKFEYVLGQYLITTKLRNDSMFSLLRIIYVWSGGRGLKSESKGHKVRVFCARFLKFHVSC